MSVDWKQQIRNCKVQDILHPHARKSVVKVFPTDDVLTLLRALASSSVQTAVMMDDTGRPRAFVDAMDVLIHIQKVAKETADGKPVDDWFKAGEAFASKLAGHVIDRAKLDNIQYAYLDSPVLDVMRMFAVKGMERVAIRAVQHDHSIVAILTSLDVLRYLALWSFLMGSAVQKPVLEVTGKKEVEEVAEDTTALACINRISEKGLQGLAVVGKDHNVIANFSAFDVVGITEESFPVLTLHVNTFLRTMNQGFYKPAVCCNETATVEYALLNLAVHNIHRIYIVDKNYRAVSSASVSDIIGNILSQLE